MQTTKLNVSLFSFTYTQVAPQSSVLRRHPEPPPVIQIDIRLGRVPAAVLLQKTPLEVRQDPVHVNQNPKLLTRSEAGGHISAILLTRLTEQNRNSSEQAC